MVMLSPVTTDKTIPNFVSVTPIGCLLSRQLRAHRFRRKLQTVRLVRLDVAIQPRGGLRLFSQDPSLISLCVFVLRDR